MRVRTQASEKRAPDMYAVTASSHPAVIALECRRAKNFPHSVGVQIGDEVRRVADADELPSFSRSNGRDGLFVGRMGRRREWTGAVEGIERQGAFPGNTNEEHPYRGGKVETCVGENQGGLVLHRFIDTNLDHHAHSKVASLGDCADSVMERTDNEQSGAGRPHRARSVTQASGSPGGGRSRGPGWAGSSRAGRDAPSRRSVLRAGRGRKYPAVRSPLGLRRAGRGGG